MKLEGRDRRDRGAATGAARRAVGISNRPLEEEWRRQAAVPPRGQGGPVT